MSKNNNTQLILTNTTKKTNIKTFKIKIKILKKYISSHTTK